MSVEDIRHTTNVERMVTLEVEVRHIREDVKEVIKEIKELRTDFDQRRGAKWVLVGILTGLGGLAGSVLTLLFKALPWFSSLPK